MSESGVSGDGHLPSAELAVANPPPAPAPGVGLSYNLKTHRELGRYLGFQS